MSNDLISHKMKGFIMKKITVCAILACCAAALFAGEIEINNTLKNSKIGASAPVGWIINGDVKVLGKGEIIQGSERDEKAFKIVTTKKGTAFYRLAATPAKAGDKVKISVDAKGKGKAVVGFYTYTGAAGYFSAVDAEKTITLTDKFQEYEFEFVVKNGKQGQTCDNIRFFLRAAANTEVTFEDIEFEVEKAK